jgi:hypothetical protein
MDHEEKVDLVIFMVRFILCFSAGFFSFFLLLWLFRMATK